MAIGSHRPPPLGRALPGDGAADRSEFLDRLSVHWPQVVEALGRPYARQFARDGGEFEQRLRRLLARRFAQRPTALRRLDRDAPAASGWFQHQAVAGYVAYVDRFAGDLVELRRRLPYLDELGTRYLHLLPVLRTAPGRADGGFAIADYRHVEPRLGTNRDLARLAADLHERGGALCIDLVLNHCADAHPWARAARAGSRRARELFHVVSDPTIVQRYEHSLGEVFPDLASGNFTHVPELEGWVWTTFNHFQWDLNWSNPDVFLRMLDILLHWANAGVDVFRLDAVPCLWKRMGTTCMNEPEVFDLLRALGACTRIAAPRVALKAEAIVSPSLLGAYSEVSDLVYHNALMVQHWSSLATRDTRLMRNVLRALPPRRAGAAWALYVRNHDDIGWAVTDEDAATVGWDGFAHRAFLADYYAGRFPGSEARGGIFGHNPATGDRRTTGTAATLCGLQLARTQGDERAVETSLRRVVLGHALTLACDGVTQVFSGDELGLPDTAEDDRPHGHEPDARWRHRVRMDWSAAARRHVPGTVEQRLFEAVRDLVARRGGLAALRSAVPLEVLDVGQPAVLCLLRPHRTAPLIAMLNYTQSEQHVDTALLQRWGADDMVDVLADRRPVVAGKVPLGPYQARWLTRPNRR